MAQREVIMNLTTEVSDVETAALPAERDRRRDQTIKRCPRAFTFGHVLALGETRCPTCGFAR